MTYCHTESTRPATVYLPAFTVWAPQNLIIQIRRGTRFGDRCILLFEIGERHGSAICSSVQFVIFFSLACGGLASTLKYLVNIFSWPSPSWRSNEQFRINKQRPFFSKSGWARWNPPSYWSFVLESKKFSFQIRYRRCRKLPTFLRHVFFISYLNHQIFKSLSSRLRHESISQKEKFLPSTQENRLFWLQRFCGSFAHICNNE